MHYIVYFSTATQLYSEATFKDILRVSRQNNTRDGITGMLLYYEGSIIQLLEGEKETVESTFRRLAKDARHHSIQTVLRGEIKERNFPQWSMGYRSLTPQEAARMLGYINPKSISEQAYYQNADNVPLIMLKSFHDVSRW
ncbi:MAG TPA: BLUF domain-containing protein [Chitinophagales bacterium]|nr:BLUF domain-containing protein [Chitinophagales bacterium]